MNEPKVRPIPEGMHTVTPHLVCAGAADAIAFYRKAFAAEEIRREDKEDKGPASIVLRCHHSAQRTGSVHDSCSIGNRQGPRTQR